MCFLTRIPGICSEVKSSTIAKSHSHESWLDTSSALRFKTSAPYLGNMVQIFSSTRRNDSRTYAFNPPNITINLENKY